jgi:hypothetical protein
MYEAEVNAPTAKAVSYLPNSYEGTTRYSTGVKESNFQMPEVFAQFEKDFFLVPLGYAEAECAAFTRI